MKYRFDVEMLEDQLEGRLLQNGCVVMYFDPRIKKEHVRRLQTAGWEYREVYVGNEGAWEEFSRQVSVDCGSQTITGRIWTHSPIVYLRSNFHSQGNLRLASSNLICSQIKIVKLLKSFSIFSPARSAGSF
jgi:hypothetical protein